ncbi:flagellar protein FlgN [Virgibacillus byunsanensis]|uniref:Flagellar protein FlgN n=1 Tax=Virgibacillus byunsanensis TaxID=570945 RepID=A0ABW3LLS1_9BACI
MSVFKIIKSLHKLVDMHKTLIDISGQKTEIIKEGSVDKLQTLLIKERKHVKAIEQIEKLRQTEVKEWFTQQGSKEDPPTITRMLAIISDDEQQKELEAMTVSLTEAITQLKQQEELNQALIQQSMQFVQLSLDMINPSIKSMNYGNKKETESIKRSVFDSKA